MSPQLAKPKASADSDQFGALHVVQAAPPRPPGSDRLAGTSDRIAAQRVPPTPERVPISRIHHQQREAAWRAPKPALDQSGSTPDFSLVLVRYGRVVLTGRGGMTPGRVELCRQSPASLAIQPPLDAPLFGTTRRNRNIRRLPYRVREITTQLTSHSVPLASRYVRFASQYTTPADRTCRPGANRSDSGGRKAFAQGPEPPTAKLGGQNRCGAIWPDRPGPPPTTPDGRGGGGGDLSTREPANN